MKEEKFLKEQKNTVTSIFFGVVWGLSAEYSGGIWMTIATCAAATVLARVILLMADGVADGNFIRESDAPILRFFKYVFVFLVWLGVCVVVQELVR